MKKTVEAQGPVDVTVGRPVPKRDKPISDRQREVLKKAPVAWEELPSGIGCTNSTLEALERRGLVETRIEPSIEPSKLLHWSGGWQWRKTPNVKVQG